MLRREPIVDAHDDGARRVRQPPADAVVRLEVHHDEPAAVEVHDHRGRGRGVRVVHPDRDLARGAGDRSILDDVDRLGSRAPTCANSTA